MAANKYGDTGSGGSNLTYGGTLCTGAIYGVEACSENTTVGGTITDVQEWLGDIEMTSNVIIQDGAAVVISCDANIDSNGNVIIVQDGGYLNTRGQRLPENSAMGSIIIFT